MAEQIWAKAQPQKRLFISLITRDISLVDAFLDLIDNSINAALEPLANDLATADDYERLLSNPKVRPKVKIEIAVGSARLVVSDNAAGISSAMAAEHVFNFGREGPEPDQTDRLSVYGIGLKRALFKCGNKISMISDHRQGGFELKLNVQEWEAIKDEPWTFRIEKRAPEKKETGTRIVITELHDDVLRRIDDGLFLNQLRDRIQRTYSFYIGRIVEITLNGQTVPKEPLEMSKNFSSEKFKSDGVSCNVTAGFAQQSGDVFRDRNAGWYVFCNGRAVIFADKTPLTGWSGAGLPIFQPKHRPFLGTVFFVSTNPEALPWTTTKSSVNEESNVWQEAKRHMVKVGREVVGFLDKRYGEEGTEITPADLQDATRGSVSMLQAAVSKARTFSPPKKPPPKDIKVQYRAKVSDIQRIESYLRRPGMGGLGGGALYFQLVPKE